ncbi:MAG: tetratricopeptide repeat protein [Phycisphaerae bacterium]
MNFQVERLKQLPQQKSEVWQGGLVKLPMWLQEENREPSRPWLAGWISLKTRLVHTTAPQPREDINFETALQSLVNFACDQELTGYRPGKIEVKDAALAEHLGGLLAEVDIKVEQRNKLFTFDEMIADMAEHIRGRPLVPGTLDSKGVTVDSMRSFADAASKFYQSEPWQYLTDEDLIEVESPFVNASLRYFTLLGAGGTTFGMGFFDSPAQLESLLEQGGRASLSTDKHWTVLFGPITELPFGDADLWEDYHLPVAGKDAYPVAICFEPGGKQRRPGPDILAFLEGLMRALAQTTEDEIDSSRWKKRETTSRGEMDFTLSLPDLLKPEDKDSTKKVKMRDGMPDRRSMERMQMDIHRMIEGRDFSSEDDLQEFLNENVVGKKLPRQAGTTPLEQAQDLMYDAFDSRGRKQLQLARKALEICPDCADAYVLLAERCSDVQKAKDLYAQSVAAGERALGEEFFEKEAGNFWGILETRPYMRARLGLAQCLEGLGQLEEAVHHYHELLRLNPMDNQGVRHMLLGCLLEMNANDEAEQLLKKYKDDKGLAISSYARALLTFRQKGNTAIAHKHLQKASSVNKYVPQYLLEDEQLPEFLPPSYSLGSEEEAVLCADLLKDAWNNTPDAIEWLESQT